MAARIDPQLLLAAFLRDAREDEAPITYVRTIQKTAMEAVLAGDEYATNLTNEGSGSTWIRGMTASEIVALCEAALQVLEAEEANETLSPNGQVKYADFSNQPCVLG